MNIKYIGMILVAMLLAVPLVHAQSANTTGNTPYATIDVVKINGDTAQNGDDLAVDRGDTLTIRVTVLAGDQDVHGAQIEAFIAGYKYAKYERNLVSDYTNTFDLLAGRKKSYDLTLQVPVDMQTNDLKLRIVLSDENSADLVTYNYQLTIGGTPDDKSVAITDFLISPSNTIEAGRALSMKVKVKNYGTSTIDDIKVKVSIPELDISSFETLDSIKVDESQSFEALLLRIPADAKPGTYDVVAEVDYDKYQSVSKTEQIEVIAAKGTPGVTPDTTSVITMPENVEIIKGSDGSVYPIMIQNQGTASKTYVLSTTGIASWGASSFEPSSVVIVQPGQSETVYLRVVANADTVAGDKVFKVTVKSGDLTKEGTVMAAVKESPNAQKPAQTTSLTTILEWVLIILILVLIVLGLVIVFRRYGSKKKDESDDEQTYY